VALGDPPVIDETGTEALRVRLRRGST
jgi:hypothetical protein